MLSRVARHFPNSLLSVDGFFESIDGIEYAINKFKKNNVIPFNISLHGGEVTTLSNGVRVASQVGI